MGRSVEITIIDYGRGNLRSVEKALQYLGYRTVVTSFPEKVAGASALVLPGVGAFDDAMRSLRRDGMDEAVREAVGSGRPFLGICLGYQLLFESSEEGGEEKGLAILPGRVKRFPEGPLKVPHMGWNSIEQAKPSPLLQGLGKDPYCYFVHSYYVEPADESQVLTWTEYGICFASGIQVGELAAFQFHPEKSSRVGLALLDSFARVATGGR